MGTKEIKPSLPRSGQVQWVCQSTGWSILWMSIGSLDEYLHWEVEGLYHPLILQEMFLHTAHSGRWEAEWMVCWGCWHGLPHLDLQVDVSVMQSVGPHTTKEEIGDLYYQVYKLRRLPAFPPCSREWAGELTKDVVSSLKNQLRWKEDELPRGWGRSEFVDTSPTQSRILWGKVFGWNWACQGKGGPPKGPGNHNCLGGEDREAELVHH